MSAKKSVAVIGAGPSGLVSIKTALDYGFEVTCFDSNDFIGGQWNYEAFKTDLGYQPVDHYDQPIPAVYKSLLMNSSKETNAFSDFPEDDNVRTFPTHWEYLEYLHRFVDAFGLRKHIKLNSLVTSLQKVDSKWRVCYNSSGNTSNAEIFDFVMIATGCFNFPNVPKVKGLSSTYKGVALHTSQVRDEVMFKGKRVLIVGGGYSGCEVAVGALNNGVEKIFFCFTDTPDLKSHWLYDRWIDGPNGERVPWDHMITRENYFENPDKFDAVMASWLHCFHSKDGTPQPKLCFPIDKLSISDLNILKQNLQSGRFVKVGPVEEFYANGVKLRDESCLDNIDFVIMGTGFVQRYPFIDKIWEPSSQVKCELYRYLLHPDPAMDGLTFICATPSEFVLFTTMEMQARWICDKVYSRTYDSEGHLFSKAERESMQDDIKATRAAQPDTLAYNFLVDGPGYWEKLSKDLGCQPPSCDELINSDNTEDVELGVAVRYGPLIAPHYRIQGPHPWPNAKKHIIQVAKQVLGDKEFQELVKASKSTQ